MHILKLKMYSELIKKKRKCSSLSPSIPGRSISAINQELYVLVFKLPVHYVIFIDVKPQEHNINNVTVTMYTIQLIIDI